MPDSLGSMDYSLARLLCPWNSPGKNTGVSSHSLLQGIFLTHGSNPGLLQADSLLSEWFICNRVWSKLASQRGYGLLPESDFQLSALGYSDAHRAWSCGCTQLCWSTPAIQWLLVQDKICCFPLTLFSRQQTASMCHLVGLLALVRC